MILRQCEFFQNPNQVAIIKDTGEKFQIYLICSIKGSVKCMNQIIRVAGINFMEIAGHTILF